MALPVSEGDDAPERGLGGNRGCTTGDAGACGRAFFGTGKSAAEPEPPPGLDMGPATRSARRKRKDKRTPTQRNASPRVADCVVLVVSTCRRKAGVTVGIVVQCTCGASEKSAAEQQYRDVLSALSALSALPHNGAIVQPSRIDRFLHLTGSHALISRKRGGLVVGGAQLHGCAIRQCVRVSKQ